MKLLLRYIYLVILPCLLMVFTACKDDFDMDEPERGTEQEEEPIDGFSIGFYISVDKSISTRADGEGAESRLDESYDNWIDTQNRFRVFFFTEKGHFLFGAIDRTVTSVKTADFTHDTWYVRVPVNVLIDRDGKEFDTDEIKEYLKTNSFRVAVLANWSLKGEVVNPGDYDDSDASSGNTGPYTLQGEPLWGVEQSVMNPAFRNPDGSFDESKIDLVKTINDLHHIYDDSQYKGKSPVYDFIMKEGKMGQPSDWVKMRDIEDGWKLETAPVGKFSNQAEANTWIKNNWNPDLRLNNTKSIYRHYQYLWQLWDFNGSYVYGPNGNTSGYSNYWGENKFADEWGARNGKVIYDWMNSTDGELPDFNEYEKLNNSELNLKNEDLFLTFVNNHTTNNSGSKRNSKNGLKGIELKNVVDLSNGLVSNTHGKNYFKFNASASGTVRVICNSQDANSTSKIVIQRSTTKELTQEVQGNSKGIVVIEKNLTINSNDQPVYIYTASDAGKPLMIYAIEYVVDKHLYDSDRENVVPSDKQPIPMYGVQLFGPITHEWKYGTTYNLSVEQKKSIALIRALAKVEVYIKKSFGKMGHIMMRSMNRTARCEPINVMTSTADLWTEQNLDGSSNTQLPHNETTCEWFKIMEYGPVYDKNNSNQADYQKKLAWFYGSWKDWWKFGSVTVPSGQVTPYPDKSEYPQIFNPYINRSDFCRFTYAGSYGEYDRYVLYMPEKNVDDPTTVGNMSSTPKVPHIEYRFADNEQFAFPESDGNLEDDGCYRIYFTNYGDDALTATGVKVNTGIKSLPRTDYDNYEKTINKTDKMHWPIMRNHIYRFYVGGARPEQPTITVKVKPWAYEKTEIEW